MKYQIVLPKRIKRKLDKIETRHYEKILSALEAFSSDPYLGKRLKGELKSYYSYRVWSYRIVYEIRKKELVILVICIGHRGGVHK